MENIEYIELTADNFSVNSLDSFKRRQKVSYCWRKGGKEYVLKPVSYIEDWSLTERRELSERILNELKKGSLAFGAVCANKIVGFALIKAGLFGKEKQYLCRLYTSPSPRD